MADLQVCYFCGSGPDGSLGEYAVVPPALDPTDEQQRSVVLCPQCRGKLTTVMEPVVEAAETAAGRDGNGSAAGTGTRSVTDGDASTADGDAPADASTSEAAASGGSADAGTPDDDPVAAGGDVEGTDSVGGSPADVPSAPSASNDPASDAAGDHGSANTDAGVDGDADASGGVDVPPAETDDGDDEISIDPRTSSSPGGSGSGDQPDSAGVDGSDADGSSAAGSDAAGPGTEGSDADEPGGDEGSRAEPGTARTPPHADDQLVGRNNEAYNKTLRLLQNREFPVERHEIEQVAANAYQLDPQEVSDAIDSLIQKGLLTQEGAHLLRP